METSSGAYLVGGLDLGLQALEMLMTRDRLGIGDVAEACDVSRSAAHRCLRTLANRGFVSLSGTGRGYFAGPRLLELGGIGVTEPHSRMVHRPALQHVRDRTGESVHSTILVGARVLVVDGLRSSLGQEHQLRIGMTARASGVAGGRLLLAAYNDEQVSSILPEDEATRWTTELRADLSRIRRAGWASRPRDDDPTVVSVAVPLDGDHWRTRMALVVSVPQPRASRERLDEIAVIARRTITEHHERGEIVPWTFDRAGRAVPVDA